MDEEEKLEFDTEILENYNYTEEVLDGLIGANVIVQHDGQMFKANIMKQAIVTVENTIGKYNRILF